MSITSWWRGDPTTNCTSCRLPVIATTVDVHGDCRHCASRAPWRWQREQLQLAVAA